MSWYRPFGRTLRIDIGRAFFSTSNIASAIEVFAPSGLISGGAPSESWRARAPVIRARSNLVSHGRPMMILLPCDVTSFSSYSCSEYVTTSSTGRFDFLVSSASASAPFLPLVLDTTDFRAAGFFVKRLITKNVWKS